MSLEPGEARELSGEANYPRQGGSRWVPAGPIHATFDGASSKCRAYDDTAGAAGYTILPLLGPLSLAATLIRPVPGFGDTD